MDSTNAPQSRRRTPIRYQSVTEEELRDEGYDDMWPTRQPSSVRRYQDLADVRDETGRTVDIQLKTGKQNAANLRKERHTIPQRRTATQGRLPAVPTTTAAYAEPERARSKFTEDYAHGPKKQRRWHWSIFVGLAMLVMIFGWITLGALGTWWQTTTDDWRYGRPRTFQTDAVVGHHDSPQNPSHFMAMNLNRHIIIIEIPGGDVSKSVVFSGPTLLGPGQDLAPVTLTFQDVNHDGKPDMIVNVQGSQFVFLNENGTFIAQTQNQGGSS